MIRSTMVNMRQIIVASVTAIAIGLLSTGAQAADVSIAPLSNAPPINATPAWQWAGYYYDGSYPPACPHGYYFACRYNHYSGDDGQCACWPYMPYWLFH
jgi:hypothetical protein